MDDPRKLFARTALTPEGWAENVLLCWDETGTLTAVTAGAAPTDAPAAAGPLAPGMPNLHSHAFQRAMAGLTEQVGHPDDSFWSWRSLMYEFATKLNPDQVEAIARQAYIEMLKGGYTSVCEFHYLHHAPEGRPYADPAELSRRVIAAAESSGIGLTLLPSLYRHGNFGAQPPLPGQRRFLHTVEEFISLLETLVPMEKRRALKIGAAPHSLRAVSPEDLRRLLPAIDRVVPTAPIHLHVAEQIREVEDCVACHGHRPVEWLLQEFPVNERWCLIHAIHLDDREMDALAASRAIVGMCPTTEGNLGDGVFRATRFMPAGGRFGIGSDSNVSLSVAEELRMLEYGQRLREQRRNRLATPATPAVADALHLAAVSGGAQASGRNVAGLAVGQQADFVILDESHPDIAARPPRHQLAGWVFCHHGASPVRDVFVNGRQVISHGHHPDEEISARNYVQTLKQLLDPR